MVVDKFSIVLVSKVRAAAKISAEAVERPSRVLHRNKQLDIMLKHITGCYYYYYYYYYCNSFFFYKLTSNLCDFQVSSIKKMTLKFTETSFPEI